MNDMKQACCPFCGSDDISAGEVMTASDQGFHYTQSECQGCGALGPRAELPPGDIDYGDVKAITAWNRRAQPEANADAKDAQRYRWLTYAGWIDDTIMETHGIREGISETLDAAIDDAIQAQKDGHANRNADPA